MSEYSANKTFQLINDEVEEETDEKFRHLDEVTDLYGVKRCLSTGLPSLNLLAMSNDDGSEYGIPYGRFTEIHGESQSAKTSHGYELCGSNLNRGGLSFYLTREMDLDEEWIRKRISEHCTDDEKLDNLGIRPVMDIGDLNRVTRGIMTTLVDIADGIEDEGGNPLTDMPPIVIVVDSLGALMGEENKERVMEEDKNKRQGSHADELHDYFKSWIYKVARCGVAWVGLNHFRANMDPFGRDTKPAYDDAIKYYCSMRLRYEGLSDNNLGSNNSGTVKQGGKEFKEGFPLKIESHKKRDSWTLDGKAKVNWYYNHGFDYLGSLTQACEWTGVFEKIKRSWKLDEDVVENDDLIDFAKNDLGKLKHSKKNWKKAIRDNPEVAVMLEDECYREGVPKLKEPL